MARRVRKPNRGGVGDGRVILPGDGEPVTIAADGPIGEPAADDNGPDSADFIISGESDAIDPNDVDASRSTGNGDSGDAPRRRGRKPGSKNRTRKGDSKTTVAVTRLLAGTHAMLALLTHNESWALTDAEAETFGNAVTDVTQLYDIPLMDEKTAAWINLGLVAGGIYGPRLVGNRLRKSRLTVVPMPAREASGPTPGTVNPQPAAPKPNGKIDYGYTPATGGGVSPVESA